MTKKYKARNRLQIGDDVYEPGDTLKNTDDILELQSWVFWGDVEVIEEKKAAKKAEPQKKSEAKAEPEPTKKAPAKKAAKKETQ